MQTELCNKGKLSWRNRPQVQRDGSSLPEIWKEIFTFQPNFKIESCLRFGSSKKMESMRVLVGLLAAQIGGSNTTQTAINISYLAMLRRSAGGGGLGQVVKTRTCQVLSGMLVVPQQLYFTHTYGILGAALHKEKFTQR